MSVNLIELDAITAIKNDDPIYIEGFDYIELYISNVRQASNFYCSTFGFEPVAYLGPEVGVHDRVSMVLQQGDIRFVLTSALDINSSIAKHVYLHGDGVKDIAFTVRDAVAAFETAVARGAKPILEPVITDDEDGMVIKSTVAACGDTVHSFVERRQFNGTFWPKYKDICSKRRNAPTELFAIDHVAMVVEANRLDQQVEFYKNVFGFLETFQQDIETKYSAMNYKVVESRMGNIKFPMMEPAKGDRKSQIEEYLEFHNGAGSQHIALLSNDIIKTVRTLQDNGIEFLNTPSTYYELLPQRLKEFEKDISTLRELNILVDEDKWGYLLQIFSKPLQTRPTLFMEIIQRNGGRTFGSGNIKALYEAKEREQLLWGSR